MDGSIATHPPSSLLLINKEREAACASKVETSEETWGDMGRYGEIWGDLEAACASKVETSEETMSSCTVWRTRRSKQLVINSLTDSLVINYVLA